MDLTEAECEVVDWIQLVQGQDPVASSCEDDDEILGSVKCGEFLDQVSNYHVLKKEPAQWS